MQRLLIYTILLLLPACLHGQQPKRYTFTHFNSSYGLVSNQVHAIVQDEKGYIWIGTTDGLQRYDGIRFKVFTHDDNDPGSLPSNYVIQLLIDKKKNLWALLADGKVGIFDTKRLRFHETAVVPRNELSMRTPIKKLITDEYGHIFLLLGGNEVLTWSETKNELSYAHNFFQQPKESRIADFVQQPGTQNYWISLQGQGVAVYNHSTRRLSYAGNNVEHIAAIDQFDGKVNPYNLFFDRKKRLWFNSWVSGNPLTYSYDLARQTMILNGYDFFPSVKTYYETRGFFEQHDSTIWIKGVMIFAQFLKDQLAFQPVFNGYENEKDIAFRVITCLFEDCENNIWVGTGNNGLFRFNPKREFFTNVVHTSRVTGAAGEGSPISFMRENSGNILVGHWGDGLYRYDKNFNAIPVNIKGIGDNNHIAVWDMFASKDSNTIWMAAQPGIFSFDQQKRAAVYRNPPLLQNRTVREIAEDKKGNLWLGMQSIGLFKWDAEKGKSKFDNGIRRFSTVPDIQVNDIMVDRKGYIWVSTSAEGAYVIDPLTDSVVMHFHKNATGGTKIPEEGVSATLDYDDSLVVITTATRLLVYNRLLKRSALIVKGHLSGNITSMERDRAGYIWISTLSALYRLHLQRKILMRFDRNDGMTNDYFILASSYVLPDGRMMFGTSAQFIVFDPAVINDNKGKEPVISITDFRVMNKPLLVDSLLQLPRVVLGPGENSLDIEFSYLRYIKHYGIKYKLEGLDDDWKIAGEDNRAIYSYLPPDTYTLLLATVDPEGNTGKNITRLIIKIRPPFWKTWWFFCLLTLTIAGCFYWLDAQRIKRLLALQKVRTEIAGNLHHEVNTTLNNISLLSEMARIKVGKDPERSIEYIAQISTKSQHMINSMDDILWSIDPENDSMEKSLLRMMEYADTLKNLHGVNIEIALDKKVKSLKLDMKTRHEVLLIFKQALRMIIQEAGGKNTLVHIDLFKSKLSVRLQDSQATIDTNTAEVDASVKEMHTRAAEAGAELDVQYDKNGVTVLLMVAVR